MDDIDRAILGSFQKDARRRNADLARERGVAPSTMLERVRRLEERGYFKGFRAILDPEKLGYSVQALVSVSLAEHRTKTIRPFEEEIHKIPHVRVCYHVSGRFDYFLLVVARDLDHLGSLVKGRIAAIPGVGRTETFIVFSEIKSDEGYPIEAEEDAIKNDGE
jgi:Lrp/AsnC family transcriptional regulator, leucine-responsive regulatory protein